MEYVFLLALLIGIATPAQEVRGPGSQVSM
jgi:hypothetical protein